MKTLGSVMLASIVFAAGTAVIAIGGSWLLGGDGTVLILAMFPALLLAGMVYRYIRRPDPH